jgi:hypothetical protein
MGKAKRAPVAGTFFDRTSAERAAAVLRARKIRVEIEEATAFLCPGLVRKCGWMLFVASDDVRRANRLLKA